MKRRGSGVLLHVTSLPSRFGIGDFGPAARRFADFLRKSSQSYWQILPLTPTSPFIGNSPYSSDSAFALNPALASPELMAEEGWLEPAELEAYVAHDPARADYEGAAAFKDGLFRRAFERVKADLATDAHFQDFCRDNAFWLDDYALFKTIKDDLGGREWTAWPEKLRDRDEAALKEEAGNAAEKILRIKFVQYVLAKQWQELRQYLSETNLLVIGDLPIYVTQDSADVWANPHLFKLGPDKNPLFIAGVPPDYFSETGQRWGNPVYAWDEHEKTGFAWWVRRLDRNLKLYDFIRLDHFRGFEAYWEIPASEETAVNGEWIKAPGRAFFDVMLKRFANMPIIAEDLGVITAEVRELKETFGFPGMKILQFAFSPGIGENRDAPHNYTRDCVAYTGTHDNNTTLGWARDEIGEEGRRIFREYAGRSVSPESVAWDLIRMVMGSVANTAVIPMQDLLSLGEKARMNMPSVAKGNWSWRVVEEQLTVELADKLRTLTDLYGRNHWPRATNTDA